LGIMVLAIWVACGGMTVAAPRQPQYPNIRRELTSASWALATESFERPDKRDYQDLREFVLDGVPGPDEILGPALLTNGEVDVYRELVEAGVALNTAVGRFASYEQAAVTPEWQRMRQAAQAMVDTLAPWRRRCLKAAAEALATDDLAAQEGTAQVGGAVATIVDELPAGRPDEMRGYVVPSDEQWFAYEKLVGAIHALLEDVGGDAPLAKAASSPRWPAVRRAARELAEVMREDGGVG
jgi:hypothetical protein